ncbi:hypothetical protein PV327_000782 [Microctonus hyperodae]|uniref:Large ribosomal subunit protein bL27m n=1 Tax=Microctonus hyperodae TaxID=165561 RepID=A0AA39G6W2_MICHY|nr:hypothetical protein PV327_000782 [Microctonus hyperodae]
MSLVSQLLFTSSQNFKQSLLIPVSANLEFIRNAAKKAGGTARNQGGNSCKAKHRGWKIAEGYAQAGKILATQNTLRWHPGLHVGMGRNGTLYAMEAGKVIVTCEKVDLDWEHSWVKRNYSGREGLTIYKKHYNVIPEKQHDCFKLIDAV